MLIIILKGIFFTLLPITFCLLGIANGGVFLLFLKVNSKYTSYVKGKDQ